MSLTEEQYILQSMFIELHGGKVIEESSSSSYNDGGNNVTTIWQVGDKFYRTRYNDWSVKHPDTTCTEVLVKTILTTAYLEK